MASTLFEPSSWLPGFDPDDMTFPDLFADAFADRCRSRVPDAAPIPSIASSEAAVDGAIADQEPHAGRRSAWYNPALVVPAAARFWWPVLTPELLGRFGGLAVKYESNLAAIRLLRDLEAAQRAPTETERLTLQRHTGWGGLPAAFNLDGSDASWVRRAEQLRALLTDAEYDSARASTNNSHYTEIHVIEAMWHAVECFGFTGGRILDPCSGVGHFIGAMPRSVVENSTITAIEIDDLSGRILKALYAPHGVDVRIGSFEKASLSDNWFDLAISNVPFGKHQVADNANYPRFFWLRASNKIPMARHPDADSTPVRQAGGRPARIAAPDA